VLEEFFQAGRHEARPAAEVAGFLVTVCLPKRAGFTAQPLTRSDGRARGAVSFFGVRLAAGAGVASILPYFWTSTNAICSPTALNATTPA